MKTSCDKCGSTPANACDDGTSQCKECRKVTGAQLMEIPVGRRRASKKAEQAAKIRKASKAKAKDGTRTITSGIELKTAKAGDNPQVATYVPPKYSRDRVKAVAGGADIEPLDADDISSLGIAEYQSQHERKPMSVEVDIHSTYELTPDMIAAQRSMPSVQDSIVEHARQRAIEGARTMEARGHEINPRFKPDPVDLNADTKEKCRDSWAPVHTGREHLFNYIEQRKALSGSAHIKAALDGMSRLLHASQSDFNADIADAVGDVCLALHGLCATHDLWLDQCIDSNLVAWAAKQAKMKEKNQ